MSGEHQESGPAVVRQALAGAAGGFLVFMILEPGYVSGTLRGDYLFGGADNIFWPGILFGGLVTALLVLAEEWALGSPARMLRRAVTSSLAGGVLGAGYSVIAHAAFAVLWPSGDFESFFPQVVARSISWACFGLGVGLSAGISSGSQRRTYQGCAGGMLGGSIGGFLFGFFSLSVSSGTLSRMAGFVILAACVGLATALVEEFTKIAWITFLSGSREGRRVLLHDDGISIGRNEHADVPLFGDPAVEPHHAVIALSPVPTITEMSERPLMKIDGRPAREAALLDGTMIEIGRHRLRFHHRYLPSKAPAPALAAEPGVSPWTSLPSAAPLPLTSTSAVPASGGPDPVEPAPVPAVPARPTLLVDASPAERLTTASGPVAIGEDFWSRPAPAEPLLALRFATGPLAGVVVPLGGDAITLGREQGNDLMITDPRMSRYHARIENLDGVWVITDQGSKNGTKLNGLPVTRAGLQPGDHLYLGETIIAVEGTLGEE
jgi:hypothetical protein